MPIEFRGEVINNNPNDIDTYPPFALKLCKTALLLLKTEIKESKQDIIDHMEQGNSDDPYFAAMEIVYRGYSAKLTEAAKRIVDSTSIDICDVLQAVPDMLSNLWFHEMASDEDGAYGNEHASKLIGNLEECLVAYVAEGAVRLVERKIIENAEKDGYDFEAEDPHYQQR
jgi:hypothetical protein